jgi:hypothetical protein
MDTTHIAYPAEDLIAHKLQRSGLLVAKPRFDIEGADLLVLMSVREGAKFCRVQCKGRSLVKSVSSNVKVPKGYVTRAFVLFLFVDDGNERETNLFCFFSRDIERSWKLKTFKNPVKDYYRLSFSKPAFNDVRKKRNLTKYSLTNHKIEEIKNVIRQADIKKELKKAFDLIKKQDDLIKLQKQKSKLEGLIKDIKHTEEVKSMLAEKITILEEHYRHLENQAKQSSGRDEQHETLHK